MPEETAEIMHAGINAELVPIDDLEDVPVDVSEADNIRTGLTSLLKVVERSYLAMGKLLMMVNKRKTADGRQLFKIWGYSSFDQFCERELGFRQRKAYHLMNIYDVAVKGPFSPDFIEAIGWSRASVLAPLVKKGIITEENADNWQNAAEGKSFEELRVISKMAQEDAGESGNNDSPDGRPDSLQGEVTAPDEVYVLRVPLFTEQWENAQTALKKAERITGSDKMPWQLDCIFTAFNAEVFDTGAEALDEVCNRIERAFGVKIVAFDAQEESVVFGDQVARMIAAMPE